MACRSRQRETDGGANAILVTDLSIDGADNGIRIKSNAARGGLVRDITYTDVCLRRVKHPIEMDTHYSASEETEGNKIPEFRDITLRNIRVLYGVQISSAGYDFRAPAAAPPALGHRRSDARRELQEHDGEELPRYRRTRPTYPLSGEGVRCCQRTPRRRAGQRLHRQVRAAPGNGGVRVRGKHIVLRRGGRGIHRAGW